MVALLVKKDGVVKRMYFDKLSIEIGRVQGNDLVLADSAVSKRHAQIHIKGTYITIVDLYSANGTFINDVKIIGKQRAKGNDEIRIASYTLFIESTSLSTAEISGTPGSEGVNLEGNLPTASAYTARQQVSSYDIPTLPSLRKLINQILRTDTDLEAFCLDYFPSIKKRFANSMERVAKVSVLLELEDRGRILKSLQEEYPQEYANSSHVLVFKKKSSIERE